LTYDLIIRRGLIVDGTGSEPFVGDIAVAGDTIVAIGDVDGEARREIDAEGHAVTPGFIDLHTHLDAQVGWDPALTPVVWHGVTTALLGNCGVTFAPCKPGDRDVLAGMMESVEDIPGKTILEGLPWDWESYGEYLDSLERLAPAINVAGLVGHCAIRTYVMGDRAVDGEPTTDEIEEMAALVGKSVAEGAVGFSSSRNNGLVQNVLEYTRFASEMEILRQQSLAAKTRTIFTAPHIPGSEGKASAYEDYVEGMRAEGLDVTALTLPRSGGFLSGLKTNIMVMPPDTFVPGSMTPAWLELVALDFEDRLEAIRDEKTRGQLIEEARGSKLVDMFAVNFYSLDDGDAPVYDHDPSASLPALAKEAGEHPAETWLRIMLETDGEALFHVRFFNHDYAAVEKFLQKDWVLPSLGDAGAHLTQIIDAGWPTFMLSHWCREKGTFSLAETVRMLTSAQARILGFSDRGTLAVGMRADINVINTEKVVEAQPRLVNDFPGGVPRLIQKAQGYRATICNGSVIVSEGEITGERAGKVLRNNA